MLINCVFITWNFVPVTVFVIFGCFVLIYFRRFHWTLVCKIWTLVLRLIRDVCIYFQFTVNLVISFVYITLP